MFNAEKVKNECVQWIRDFFEENGKGCNAVIGISGGKDSSVVAALCVEALGKDSVIGVLMPNGEQADIDKAQLLVDTLGIKHYIINIKDATDALPTPVISLRTGSATPLATATAWVISVHVPTLLLTRSSRSADCSDCPQSWSTKSPPMDCAARPTKIISASPTQSSTAISAPARSMTRSIKN